MTAPADQAAPPAAPAKTAATPKKTDAPPKRTIGTALREFEPDMRWFVPAIAGLNAYTLTGLLTSTGLPAWWLIAPGGALTAIGVWLARHFYRPVDYGHQQRLIAQWVAVAGGAAMTAWMVYAGMGNPLRPAALGLLVLVVLVCGAAFAALHTRAPAVKAQVERDRAERQEVGAERVEEAQLAQARDEWQEIAEQAKPGCGITLLAKTMQEGGFYLDFADHPTKPIKFNGFTEMVPSMLSIASARLAPSGVTLEEGDLCPEQLGPAHLFRLHVFTSNEFAKPVPYPMDRPVGTIREPRILGKYKDMTPLGVCLCGNHGVMCAGTGGGKTVFANCMIAGVLECGDAEVWVGATSKLAPLVYPWLLPWLLGRTTEPALKYVAGEDARSVTEMLAELYREAKRRNSTKLGRKSKIEPSRDLPAIVCFIEEASNLLMYHQDVKVKTFDGHNWNASQILNAIAEMARAAAISIFLLTQYGIMDALGDHGSLMRRNLTIRVCGRTYTYSDGSDILTAISRPNTTRLKDNTLLVQPAMDELRVMAAKAYFLDGAENIGPVAEKYTARRTDWHPPTAGAAYRERWSAQRLPELAGIALDEGLSWPGSVHTGAPFVASEMDPPALPAANTGQESDTMSDDVKDTLAQANAKMDVAIQQAAKYGPLGPLMGEIMDKVNAENAPEFIPAGLLAHIIGRVPQDGDWDTAGDTLVGELRGTPWHLSPTVRDGKPGWPKGQILGTIRAYLEGRPVPGEGTGDENSPSVGELLGVLVRELVGDDREFITAVDAAGLVGLSAAELQRQLEGEPFRLPVQRPRTVADGERPRGWFVADLRRAAGV